MDAINHYHLLRLCIAENSSYGVKQPLHHGSDLLAFPVEVLLRAGVGVNQIPFQTVKKLARNDERKKRKKLKELLRKLRRKKNVNARERKDHLLLLVS